MWRQARNPSWIWFAVAGAVLLVSPQGRKAVARWARVAAQWLEGAEGRGRNGSRGRGEEGPASSGESRQEPRGGGHTHTKGSRDEEDADGQVVWWVTKPTGAGVDKE